MTKNPKIEKNWFNINEDFIFWIFKFWNEMYVGRRTLPTSIHNFLVKFQNSKIHNVLDIKPISLKLWIFTNFNTVFIFPVVLLVFDHSQVLVSFIFTEILILKLEMAVMNAVYISLWYESTIKLYNPSIMHIRWCLHHFAFITKRHFNALFLIFYSAFSNNIVC
jgi:hypothetical protein